MTHVGAAAAAAAAAPDPATFSTMTRGLLVGDISAHTPVKGPLHVPAGRYTAHRYAAAIGAGVGRFAAKLEDRARCGSQ